MNICKYSIDITEFELLPWYRKETIDGETYNHLGWFCFVISW